MKDLIPIFNQHGNLWFWLNDKKLICYDVESGKNKHTISPPEGHTILMFERDETRKVTTSLSTYYIILSWYIINQILSVQTSHNFGWNFCWVVLWTKIFYCRISPVDFFELILVSMWWNLIEIKGAKLWMIFMERDRGSYIADALEELSSEFFEGVTSRLYA